MKRISIVFSLVVVLALFLGACAPAAPVAPVVQTVEVIRTQEVLVPQEVIVTQQVVMTVEVEKPQELQKLVIGFSWNEKMHSLIQAWQDYMVAYAAEACPKAGYECEFVFNVADSDPQQQASNLEDLINQGVNVIGARAHDAAAIGASIVAANEASIPFVTFDRESSTVPPAVHVGADSYTQAVTTAEEFAKILEKNGVEGAQCIELQGDLRDQNAVYRSQGWADVEKKLKDAGSPFAWTTVVQVPTEWNPEKFLTGTQAALEAHPEANCMFVASDFAFDSVMQALEAAGKAIPSGEEGHIWIAAQDVNPQGYTAMEQGIIDVATTYDAYFHSVEFVNAVLRVASGEELGVKKILVPGRVATLENFKELPNMWALDYKE
ncbi:MAG TPA: sugar ABC transporter substrate-binding protein [Anaerolineales bacterium]|nr:sugar ABC transporter substrate-binding protein [Anaerolineales bacterium]